MNWVLPGDRTLVDCRTNHALEGVPTEKPSMFA